MSVAREFFSKDDIVRLETAIAAAEQNTSGEICLHIDSTCISDPVEKAKEIFIFRGLHKTKDRNAVLFYMALKDHKYAIWGDLGINEKVPEGFWEDVSLVLLQKFKLKQFTLGLEEAILMTGEKLKQYFPYESKRDINELADEVSFDKE